MKRCLWAKRILTLSALLLAASEYGYAQHQAPRFKAVAFDYFVLFDANSVLPAVENEFPGKGPEFVKAWRSKQFEYGFLRSITHQHRDFLRVTDDALVYTAHLMNLELKPEVRQRLLNAYLSLKLWPDAAEGLRRLRAAGVRIITIANFMLTRAQGKCACQPEFEWCSFDESRYRESIADPSQEDAFSGRVGTTSATGRPNRVTRTDAPVRRDILQDGQARCLELRNRDLPHIQICTIVQYHGLTSDRLDGMRAMCTPGTADS